MPESVDWQVLIVDNNSKDQTREVAETFCQRDPSHFRYIFEPQQGKSFALNRGIREASGEILAFIDDDITVEPTFLRADKALVGFPMGWHRRTRLFAKRLFTAILDGPRG
jgi:glycosyltransferase involved in cell wall biosynthesis